MDTTTYKNCQLCPRDCRVDRAQGKVGVCGETAELRISHLGPHFGEEPSFSGTRGSGTIFFSGCSSQCFFCQNHQISTQHCGRVLTSGELLSEVQRLLGMDVNKTVIPAPPPAKAAGSRPKAGKAGIQECGSPTKTFRDDKEEKCQGRGVHNLNFVTPDHFWPHIKELCLRLREQKILIPKVFNSSGYQKPEMIAEYAEFMDMFMPDFKFAEGGLAKLCMGDGHYPEVALEAIRRMVKAKGFLEPWDPAGDQTAERGVLVRHLVLPGYVENSLHVLELLCREFGPGIPISVMSQFRPVLACSEKHLMTRSLKPEEYDRVLELVEKLGFEKVYTQELREDTAFLPDFKDPEDPFPGNRGLKKKP